MKTIGKLSSLLPLIAFGFLLHAAAPIPRPAPALTFQEPSGKTTTLASLKGKVVVVQFLYTGCSHCQATAMWLSRLQSEMGSKGLQVYGFAFNPEVNTPDAAKNKAMTARFSDYAKFPVGFGPPETVEKFMGFSVLDQYLVPQLVVIDKKGVIRAQTSPNPKPSEIAAEPVLRALVTKLLAENAKLPAEK